MRYKKTELPLKEIANELGVRNVLEGSVRKSGNKVRIAVQLIDAQYDKPLWAETFDREMQDIFGVQTDIATKVAAALEAKLSSEEQAHIAKKSTHNTEAYQLYLQGRYNWNKRSKEALKTGAKFFQQAVEKDPNYALAYAGLGDSYLMFGVYEIMPPRDCFPVAKKYIQKALQLDNSLAEAYATLIDINVHYDWDVEEGEANFRRAVTINPNYGLAYHWHSEILVMRRQFEKAMEASQMALSIDPYSSVINNQLATNFIYAGHFQKALEQLRKTLAYDSTFAVAHHYAGILYTALKQYPQALLHFGRAMQLDPTSIRNLAATAYVQGITGNKSEAFKIQQQILKTAESQYVPSYHLAVAELGLAKQEQALNYLEQAYNERSPWMPFLRMNPLFNSLHQQPRFKTLVKKIEKSQ
jgi:tetratricopeptide (TPR) repeat protein